MVPEGQMSSTELDDDDKQEDVEDVARQGGEGAEVCVDSEGPA